MLTKEKSKSVWSPYEREAWRLPGKMTVSQWADQNRILDRRASSEFGPWRTSRVPYLRAIMDAYSDPEGEEITVIKPTQAGVSEAIFNMIGYTVDCDPAPSGLMEARDDDFKYLVENRLRPMVEKSEVLKKHITSEHDLGYEGFNFDNMPLYFMGSNSPAASSSKPIKNMFFDEIKDYPPFAGKVSNPLDRGKDRTDTYPDRKLMRVSSLQLASDLILHYYSLSNQQQYYMPCYHCGDYLTWK
jgi:phage terminase large subunit GpA-like protein